MVGIGGRVRPARELLFSTPSMPYAWHRQHPDYNDDDAGEGTMIRHITHIWTARVLVIVGFLAGYGSVSDHLPVVAHLEPFLFPNNL